MHTIVFLGIGLLILMGMGPALEVENILCTF